MKHTNQPLFYCLLYLRSHVKETVPFCFFICYFTVILNHIKQLICEAFSWNMSVTIFEICLFSSLQNIITLSSKLSMLEWAQIFFLFWPLICEFFSETFFALLFFLHFCRCPPVRFGLMNRWKERERERERERDLSLFPSHSLAHAHTH